MPGGLSTTESKVEGTTEISVIPGWIPGSDMKLGVYRNNKMNKDEAVLVVQTKLMTVQSKDGLSISIDGVKSNFSSEDQLSDLSEGYFSKRFTVKIDYIRRMVSGKSVWVRVNGNGSTYAEGEFSREGYTTAKPGFKKFLEKI
jgi:hypothetical protein